jgi:hypothetical protein
VKGWKKISKPMFPEKKAGGAILLSEKVNFKLTLIKRDKGHFILIKVEIHQKEITIIDQYGPNVNAPNFIKHNLKDFKAHIDSNTVVVRDINILHYQFIGHLKKINKEF